MRAPSRRAVLRAGAGATLALPLLQAISGARTARAAAAPPKRLLFFVTSNGSFPERFWPTPEGAAPIPERTPARGFYSSGNAALDTTAFALSPILEPLAAHRSDLLVLEGLDNCDGLGGHDMYTSLLTGAKPFRADSGVVQSSSISVDLHAAAHLGRETKFPSLQLGVVVGDQHNQYGLCSWHKAGQAAVAQNDPARVFERLFGALDADPAALAALRDERKSVLDVATKQLGRLTQRLGRQDRDKLDNYLTSLRAAEQRLTSEAVVGASCRKPEAPAARDPWNHAQIPQTLKTQLDLLVMALTCDLTRVATVQVGQEGGQFTHPWLGVTQGFHDLSHAADDDFHRFGQIATVNRWYAEQLDYLVKALKSVPEGSGTIFDNTVIVWLTGMTKGNVHSNANQPCVVLGRGGGYFKGGRYVRFARDEKNDKYGFPFPRGHALNDLYVDVLRAVGVPTDSFGDAKFCRGPLPGLAA